ncbi:hypothetical protein BDV59DRAFT_177585 [Aspergillus ambiguus]|uniref:GILT family protein n=1 Tax=Aspergillus ambiguus TaxID=176160 RepID=UPI003CCDD6E8
MKLVPSTPHPIAIPVVLLLSLSLVPAQASEDHAQQPIGDYPDHGEPVPLEAHIMSKCPDARDCLRTLIVPTMEQVSDKVDFHLSFIANISDKSSDITCMHGPEECIGDSLILCAENLPFKPDDASDPIRMPTIRSLGFANCLLSTYQKVPAQPLVQDCAAEHGIDFDALNACASRQEDDPKRGELSGLALLRESAVHNARLGIKTSCTVRLDEKLWCVHDDGVWRDCAKGADGSTVPVLVEEVKRLWQERN